MKYFINCDIIPKIKDKELFYLFIILPVDQNAGALPRQTWIDFCVVLASVLHRDPP